MTLPTGTFSSPYPGKLTVVLTATFFSSYYRDAGFPSSGGTSGGTNVALRAYAGPSGSPTYGQVVDKFNGIASFVLDYPGGGAAWPVGVQLVANIRDMTGIWAYGMDPVQLLCKLEKKT